MINLLPPEYKQHLMYGRRNTRLRKWVVALIVALAGVGLIVIGGQYYMRQTIKSQEVLLQTEKESLKTQKAEETEKRLAEISANTKLVVQVLSREILFSKLLRQLGSSLPANTTLQQFQIDKVEGGLTLRALATDIDAATQLQVNLQDPQNKIFEKADIESINCSPPSPGTKYPCVVQLRALFSKDNPYVYISSAPAAATEKKQ